MRWPTIGPTSSFMHSPRSPCFHKVVRRIREQGHKVLLVAPLWRNQPWLSELTQLLTAAPLARAPETGSSSLRRTEQYGTLDPSCGLSTFGRSMGAYWLPRASVKHHF